MPAKTRRLNSLPKLGSRSNFRIVGRRRRFLRLPASSLYLKPGPDQRGVHCLLVGKPTPPFFVISI